MHRTAIAQTSVYTYGAGVDILKQNQGFPCVFQQKQIYLLTILLALLQTMKHQSKLSFNPQQLLTKLGVFKRKQNQCRCPL